jgi:hypothetical protein
MGEIYQHAKNVIVWLGEGSPGIAGIFTHLTIFHKLSKIKSYSIKTRLQRLLALRIAKIQRLDEKSDGQLPIFFVPPDRILHDLFSRTWFSRMWTIQEVVLGKRCLVQCGSATVCWSVLHNLEPYFFYTQKRERADDPLTIHRGIHQRISYARDTGWHDNWYDDPEYRILSILQ